MMPKMPVGTDGGFTVPEAVVCALEIEDVEVVCLALSCAVTAALRTGDWELAFQATETFKKFDAIRESQRRDARTGEAD